MKKIKVLLLAAIVLMACSSSCLAAWTLTPSIVSRAGHYLTWKVVCTSDGGALTATDLVALMSAQMKAQVQGATQMIMKVSPGTGGVVPDATIDVTLSDAQGAAIFVHTAYSNLADTTGISLAEDYNAYPTDRRQYHSTRREGEAK